MKTGFLAFVISLCLAIFACARPAMSQAVQAYWFCYATHYEPDPNNEGRPSRAGAFVSAVFQAPEVAGDPYSSTFVNYLHKNYPSASRVRSGEATCQFKATEQDARESVNTSVSKGYVPTNWVPDKP
jgi:hypothetical protein